MPVDDWERLPPSYELPEGHSGEQVRYVGTLPRNSTITLVVYEAEQPGDIIVTFLSKVPPSPNAVYRVPGWSFTRFLIEQGFVPASPCAEVSG